MFGVAAVIGKAAELRARAVYVAGPKNRPGHVPRIRVDEFQLAPPLLATVVLPLYVVLRLLRLREPSPDRVEHEVGGDEDELSCQVSEDLDILPGVGRIVADAIDDQVPPGAQVLEGLLETIRILPVRLDGRHSLGQWLLPACDDPDPVPRLRCASCKGAADEATSSHDQYVQSHVPVFLSLQQYRTG